MTAMLGSSLPISVPESDKTMTEQVATDDGLAAPRPRPAAPFSCNVCNRSYSRVDHLARHYRSHTKEKPFRCDECGSRFSRADLLRRHAAAHINRPADKRQKSGRSLPVIRVSSACGACSAAKVRCSENKPCARCVQSNITCEVSKPHSEVDYDVPPMLPLKVHGEDSPSAILVDFTAATSEPEQDVLPQPNVGLVEPSRLSVDRSVAIPKERSTLAPTPRIVQPSHSFLEPDAFEAQRTGYDQWSVPDSSLADFLAQIMVPLPSPCATRHSTTESIAEEHDFFSFGIDDGKAFDEFDFGFPEDTITAPFNMPALATDTSGPPSRNDDGVVPMIHSQTTEAFMRSLWQWIPGKLDQGHCEQLNLSLPSNLGVPSTYTERPCAERLSQSARDRILAMVASTCDPSAFLHIASNFPSVDILDCLVQDYLFIHRQRAVSFIHVPTFSLNEYTPELVAMTAGCGAVLNSVPSVRKLGNAIQEAIRLAGPRTWEKDNSRTRDLQMLQAYAMCLDVGVWSGNKRKMEIAEAQQQPLVTMLRRSGRFRRPRSTDTIPLPNDTPDELNKKWRMWAEAESWKRLAFALFVHDARVSMSLVAPPIITSTELTLGLPAATSLWNAATSILWRDEYLRLHADNPPRAPTILMCVKDAQAMVTASKIIDVPFSRHIILSMFWRQIWDFRQLNMLGQTSGGQDPSSSLCQTARPWRQECAQGIRHFRMVVSDVEPMSDPAALVHEHLLLNIFVSFEELSRFSGKDGTSEATKALPILRQWAKGRDSRQAIFHAGQLIRKASAFPPGLLRDFYAIALYHAGLTLWAYGLLSNDIVASGIRRESFGLDSLAFAAQQDVVLLDSSDDPDAVEKFISLGRGLPAIHEVSLTGPTRPFKDDSSAQTSCVLLRNPAAAMETVTRILQRNHRSVVQRYIPLLVENLIHLMSDLSSAALKINKP